ncbi:T9SS type A sorting domain-containing protein [Empedobacter falsenii]
MKKIYLIAIMIIASFMVKAQKIDLNPDILFNTSSCILGDFNFSQNAIQTFTSANDAQCTDCYLWKVISGNIEIVGSNKNKTVSIKGNQVGPYVLSLTYLNSEGCNSCEISGNITAPTPTNCGIPNDRGYYECGMRNRDSENRTRVYIETPLGGFDWSNIAKITVRAYGQTVNETGYTQGDDTYTKNNPTSDFTVDFISKVIGDLGEYCRLYSNYVDVVIVYTFKNNCPPITKTLRLDNRSYPTSLQKDNIDQITLDNNPVHNTLSFKSELSIKSINIINDMGKELVSSKISNNSINVQNLKAGTYIYKLTLENGTTKVGKFIKK